MTSNSSSEAEKRVVRRNTDEVQGGGNFAVFEELFADDFLDHTPQPEPASPSIVVTPHLSARKAGTTQLCTGLPSRWTVHAPQSPASQPFFTTNQPSSRRKVSRHWPGRGAVSWRMPLTRKLMHGPPKARSGSLRRTRTSCGGANPVGRGCRRSRGSREFRRRAALLTSSW